MKIIPIESPDIAEMTQYIGSLSNEIKELEKQLQLGYTINGLSINSIVMEHLKKLNLAKSTSKNKMLPRTDKFSVSQSSYDCYRKIYLEMQYPQQVTNEDSLGRFAVGDIVDDIMKGALESVGAVTGRACGCGEDYFDGAFRIQGESDADFSDLVVEVKSVSPFAWKYVAGGRDKLGNVIVGEPKIQHVRQLNTYLDIKGIEDGVLIYVSKDNFQLKTYPVKHSHSLMTQTVGRCAIVHRAIMEKKVPDKIKGDECSFCGHKDMCREYP